MLSLRGLACGNDAATFAAIGVDNEKYLRVDARCHPVALFSVDEVDVLDSERVPKGQPDLIEGDTMLAKILCCLGIVPLEVIILHSATVFP